MAEQHQWA